jgi:tetratricopeptide (TPR) repeat protein
MPARIEYFRIPAALRTRKSRTRTPEKIAKENAMESKRSKIGTVERGCLALLFVAALLMAIPVSAQYAPKQQPAQQPAKPPAPQTGKPGELPLTETPPVNKEEEDAAKLYFALTMQQATQTIQAGEDFLQKYPDSRYRDSVYAKLVHAYLNAGQEDKVVAKGEKALSLNPDNIDVLAFMGWYLGHRYHPNALDAEQRLQSAEKYSRHALELLENFQQPAGMAEEEFTRAKNEKQGLCHSGLGLFYYWGRKTPEMISELTQSTMLDPSPDPTDFYLLGDGEVSLKRYADAERAYDHCSQTPWAWQAKCKTKLAQVQAILAAQPAAPAAPPAAPLLTQPAADPSKPKPPKF